MYIPQKYIDVAVNHTDEKRKALGVVYDEQYLEHYIEKLRGYKAQLNVAEGDNLPPAQWTAISTDIMYLVFNAARKVESKDETFRHGVKADEYVLSALRHMVAVTSKELGCPQIPIADFRAFFNAWMEPIVASKPVINISLDNTFNNQRRIDATYIRSDILQPIFEQLEAKNNVSENVGKLYAEYRALVKRQEMHTPFWRFFHSGENKQRNELIKELESTLKSYAPHLNFNSKTPLQPHKVIRAVALEEATNSAVAGVKLYDHEIPTAFGYKDVMINDMFDDGEIKINNDNVINKNPELKKENADKKVENKEKNVKEAENNGAAKDAKEEVVKEEKKEEKKEIIAEQKKIEKPEPMTVSALLKKIDGYDFYIKMKDELWEVIYPEVSYSVNKESIMHSFVTDLLHHASYLNKAYDKAKANNESPETMDGVISHHIGSIFGESFHLLERCNMITHDRIALSQKICDFILDKATVIGLEGDKYSKYATNYALSSDNVVFRVLQEKAGYLNKDLMEFYIQKARKKLGIEVVDDSKKEEEKKPVADNVVLNDPAKEKLVIEDPLANAGDVVVSERINEHDAPAPSKVIE